ncbi:hypothetical protein [Methylobacterium sp. J-092]|uniref:hypothetical protein n=1 Tax=Methylobacterium sp. J-092 TaxID=2836667 RepID=UPI001FBA29FC|nr:hypothetical protein [Methylobacterium sp. J-092]MCJ2008757.1 hypothetical protein [Methylobacterium sp. J-092]
MILRFLMSEEVQALPAGMQQFQHVASWWTATSAVAGFTKAQELTLGLVDGFGEAVRIHCNRPPIRSALCSARVEPAKPSGNFEQLIGPHEVVQG